MSLFKQLWIGLTLVMIATFYVSYTYAEHKLSLAAINPNTNVTTDLSIFFLLIWIIAGSLATLGLYFVTRPLFNVVKQAENIGHRRFTKAPIPFTSEFRRLVTAMNSLSHRVQRMLEDESQRLQTLQHKLQQDTETGLLNRPSYMSHLCSYLTRNDDNAFGSIVIIRIMSLSLLNQRLGRAVADQLIRQLAKSLNRAINTAPDWVIGRLNGTDISILAPHTHELTDFINTIKSIETELATDFSVPLKLAIGITNYNSGEKSSHVFSRLDTALAASELNLNHKAIINRSEQHLFPEVGLSEWRIAIDMALKQNMLTLIRKPVVDQQGLLIHEESSSQLCVFKKHHNASAIMPWIHRMGWQSRFDSIVIETAIVELHQNATPISVHLCAESISNIQFRHSIHTIFAQTPRELLSLLSIEIPESAAFEQLIDFKSFCQSLKRFPCKIGLKHFGMSIHNLAPIHDLGLDYLKLDFSLMVQLDKDADTRSFVQGICSVAHAVGIKVIAPGSFNQTEKANFVLLGIDGFSSACPESEA